MHNSNIQNLVLNSVSERWLKVALVIARVLAASNDDLHEGCIANEIKELVQNGKIELRGDVENYRHCEVRAARLP